MNNQNQNRRRVYRARPYNNNNRRNPANGAQNGQANLQQGAVVQNQPAAVAQQPVAQQVQLAVQNPPVQVAALVQNPPPVVNAPPPPPPRGPSLTDALRTLHEDAVRDFGAALAECARDVTSSVRELRRSVEAMEEELKHLYREVFFIGDEVEKIRKGEKGDGEDEPKGNGVEKAEMDKKEDPNGGNDDGATGGATASV